MTNNPEHEPGTETELTLEQQAALAGIPDDIASEIADVWKHPDEDTALESEEGSPDTFPDAWLEQHDEE